MCRGPGLGLSSQIRETRDRQHPPGWLLPFFLMRKLGTTWASQLVSEHPGAGAVEEGLFMGLGSLAGQDMGMGYGAWPLADTEVCRSQQGLGIPILKDTRPTGTMFHICINRRTVQNPLPINPGQVWGPGSRDTPRALVPKGRRLHSLENSAGPGQGPEFVFCPPEGRKILCSCGVTPCDWFHFDLKRGSWGPRGGSRPAPSVQARVPGNHLAQFLSNPGDMA